MGPLEEALRERGGERGLKDHSEEFFMSHLWPSLHQCGGCKAPEQVGKPLALKNPSTQRELWPAVSSETIVPALLNKIILGTHVHAASCHVCQVMWNLKQSVCTHRESIYKYIYVFFLTAEALPLHARCRALTCVEHLREKSGWSPGARSFSQTQCACACFKTGRGNVVKSKVCYSNSAPQEPLNRYLSCLLWAKWPSRQLCF